MSFVKINTKGANNLIWQRRCSLGRIQGKVLSRFRGRIHCGSVVRNPDTIIHQRRHNLVDKNFVHLVRPRLSPDSQHGGVHSNTNEGVWEAIEKRGVDVEGREYISGLLVACCGGEQEIFLASL